MTIRTEYETLEVEVSEAVVTATINRPKVLNALNEQVILDLLTMLDETALASGARVLVITGSGEKAFVAGADIGSMKGIDTDSALSFSRLGQELTKALEDSPFVTIAKINGFALGGGCELAMACDIAIASERSLFGQPEVDLGLIAGFGGTQRLTQRVGLPMAMDILVGGRKLNGREAYESGIISRVCPTEELDDAVDATIANILKSAPLAIQESKRLVRESLDIPLHLGLSSESTAFANCFGRDESKEGISAFLEKRKATFSL
ncbi:MAG: enoyl-CoA hydratase/isomerase family protein [Pseudobacteriovorax sp.]|nr:enoyl-CoA hydratase/isomerase family protein [Pseudobacteriovorax sp.]